MVIKKQSEKKVEKVAKQVEKKRAGRVFTYFSHVGVAGVDVEAPIKVGDTINVKGATTDFTQKIESMQIDNKIIKEAKKGDSIGLKVKDKVRRKDVVYKVG